MAHTKSTRYPSPPRNRLGNPADRGRCSRGTMDSVPRRDGKFVSPFPCRSGKTRVKIFSRVSQRQKSAENQRLERCARRQSNGWQGNLITSLIPAFRGNDDISLPIPCDTFRDGLLRRAMVILLAAQVYGIDWSAGLAQWQCSGFVNRRSGVRIPHPAPFRGRSSGDYCRTASASGSASPHSFSRL
jgi:hypothetical protein